MPPTYNAGYSTNCQALTLPIGTTNVHALIDMPPTGDDPNSALGQQRYYNKADLVLLVSNSTVTLTLKTSPADPQAPISPPTYYLHQLQSHQLRPDHHQFPFPHHHQYLHRSAGKRHGQGRPTLTWAS